MIEKEYIIETINRAGQIENRIFEKDIQVSPFSSKYRDIYKAITKAHEISIINGKLEKISTNFSLNE